MAKRLSTKDDRYACNMCVVVTDLQAAVDFFVDEFGFTSAAKSTLAGPRVDALCDMKNVQTEYVPLALQGSTTKFFLLKYVHPHAAPTSAAGQPNGRGNHASFAVDDIDAFVTQLSNRGWQLLSEVQFVADMKLKTVYFHGPEKILI
jgi:catechol 2,3-dioxygenase-like lactoylglutathione lyase family enzyme